MSDHAARVAAYYDANTEPFYRRLWDGEDLHFGLFDGGLGLADLRAALKRMTRAVVEPARLTPADVVVDAGCGVGGAALDVAAQHGCRVTGLTISARQVEIATARAARQGLAERARFERADCAARLPFDDGQVDAVISIEAACHFPDRLQFVRECRRVLRPGGWLAFSDWLAADGVDAAARRALIDPLCDAWLLAGLESLSSWSEMLRSVGFTVVACADFGDVTLPNVRLLQRARQNIRLEAAGGRGPGQEGLWLAQLDTLIEAWGARHFTLGHLIAIRP